MTWSARSPRQLFIQRSIWTTFAATLRWVSVAPLATPVVPPVYCRKATSSSPTLAGFAGDFRPSASTVLNGIAAGRLYGFTAFFTCRETRFTIAPFRPMRSPGVTTTTLSRRSSGSASSTVWPKFEHEEDAGAGIAQLMDELARRVERVDVDDRVAGREDAVQ